MAISEKLYTWQEFEAFAHAHPDRLLELIDGRIVEKYTSELRGVIIANIGTELRQFVRNNNSIKGHYATSASYRPRDDNYNIRCPDFSFRVTDEPVSTANHVVGIPDFCVEVKSPTNSYDELRDKARLYLANAAKLVWLVYPDKRLVEVYFADGSSEFFKDDETLNGADVLPDFSMKVAEIFEV